MVYLSAVTHPSSNRARCGATTLIEDNMLPLHHADHPNNELYMYNQVADLEKSLSFARMDVIQFLFPLHESVFIDYLKVVEVHEHSQQQP